MARVFTREEFYELVWTKPVTQLAKEFALSDVALHKICRKHAIPNPPPGWWAKLAAGKPVSRTPLPEVQGKAAVKVTFADANLCRETPTLAMVRENARILAAESDLHDADARHPVIERTLVALRKAKPSDRGVISVDGVGLIRCEIGPGSIDRLGIILRRIAAASLVQGFQLTSGDKSAHFASATETIAFSVLETIRREKHALTSAERAAEAAWQRKQERRRHSWDTLAFFDRPQFPEWDYRPTGLLSLELEHHYWGGLGAPRRSFRDAKVQRLENMASDVAVGLAVYAVAKTEERLKREADQRRAEEARQRREAAARLRHIKERRSAGLNAVLAELDEIDRLRRLIGMLSTSYAGDKTPRVATFLEWARNQLAEREARVLPDGLERRFEAEHLFADTDDHDFRGPIW